MQLTRFNFYQNLPFLLQKIKEAQYVAFDFEFSGVSASPLLRNSPLDSIQTRYWKTKENIKRFLHLQMGICTINDNILHPFNLYLYPFTMDGYLDKQFQFSSSSVAFLAENNFDFNRTFYEGIYFISHQDEKILIESKQLDILKQDMRFWAKKVTFEMEGFYAKYKEQINKFFLDANQTTFNINVGFVKQRVQRHLIERMKKDFENQEFHITYDTEVFFKRTVLTINKGQDHTLETKPIVEIGDGVGARMIFDTIKEHKIPLIVHNGLLDIYHIYDKFFYNLPDTAVEFKQQINQIFPTIYDTKFIVNQSYELNSRLKARSDLKLCYEQLNVPKVEIGKECAEYLNDNNQTFEHQAGYDAMMTASVFLAIQKEHSDLKPFKNKLPQASIKVPFDTETYDDKFHSKHTIIFHLQQLEKVLVPENLIKDHFQATHSSQVQIYLSYGLNFEYFLQFYDLEVGKKVKASLVNGSTAINIGEHQFVLSQYETYVETLQRRAKDELTLKSMPSILETNE